jgi:class 3 adenylate cyclase
MLHQARQTVFRLALEAIQQYKGTLQHVRDEDFLALFGAPVAHEDHAQRAVLAALAVQQRLGAAPGGGAAGTLGMGVHTGSVVLGRLGDEPHLTYTAVGETTQRAAWLAQQAAPGTILVSATTALLVHGVVALEACAPALLPGQTDLGPVYQVRGLVPRTSPLLPDGARLRSRFVGRELELTTLQALLTRVVEGQGQVAGIVGEPGWARRGSWRNSGSGWGRCG